MKGMILDQRMSRILDRFLGGLVGLALSGGVYLVLTFAERKAFRFACLAVSRLYEFVSCRNHFFGLAMVAAFLVYFVVTPLVMLIFVTVGIKAGLKGMLRWVRRN